MSTSARRGATPHLRVCPSNVRKMHEPVPADHMHFVVNSVSTLDVAQVGSDIILIVWLSFQMHTIDNLKLFVPSQWMHTDAVIIMT